VTRVLITGAAGLIGRTLRTRLARPGRTLRLLDIAPQHAGPEEIVTADVTDPSALTRACTGVDAVVHLAGIANEAPWADILRVNIDGTRAVLEAAQAAGIRRVVLASSNHATGFTERGTDSLPADVEIRPDTYYGISKAAMEALGKLYADRYGMDVIALRIGSCFEQVPNIRALATWLSPDDCGRLVEAALTTPAPGYRVIWGISRNMRRWWSLAAGEDIGYHPVDDAEAHAGSLLAGQPDPDWAEDPDLCRVGGAFCRTPLGAPVR
jgi:nucleoside-diphosphate-sugar epimerase